MTVVETVMMALSHYPVLYAASGIIENAKNCP